MADRRPCGWPWRRICCRLLSRDRGASGMVATVFPRHGGLILGTRHLEHDTYLPRGAGHLRLEVPLQNGLLRRPAQFLRAR